MNCNTTHYRANSSSVPGDPTSACGFCHATDQGRGSINIISLARSGTEGPFKTAQLRSLLDKVGMDGLSTNSRVGFGFMHDGRIDTLTRFLMDGFTGQFPNDQSIADVVAFLLCFTGSDVNLPFLPPPPGGQDTGAPISGGRFLPSQDVPAATGRQITFVSGTPPLLIEMTALAIKTNSRVDLILRGKKEGRIRHWLLRRTTQDFQSDRHGEIASNLADVAILAGPGNEFTATLVPRGAGTRLALDRDGDGFFNASEVEAGFDPNDPASHPSHPITISKVADNILLSWPSMPGATYAVEWATNWPPAVAPTNVWTTLSAPFAAPASLAIYTDAPPAGDLRRYYRVRLEP